jgi:hypothetical protein
LIYNKGINRTFQRKFRKENRREFQVETKRFTHNQFKELFERLLLRALKNGRLEDSWSIEYQIKDDDEPRYQELSSMNEICVFLNLVVSKSVSIRRGSLSLSVSSIKLIIKLIITS